MPLQSKHKMDLKLNPWTFDSTTNFLQCWSLHANQWSDSGSWNKTLVDTLVSDWWSNSHYTSNPFVTRTIVVIYVNWIMNSQNCNHLSKSCWHINKAFCQIKSAPEPGRVTIYEVWRTITWLLLSDWLFLLLSGKCMWQRVSSMTRLILLPPLPMTCECSVCETSIFSVTLLLCNNHFKSENQVGYTQHILAKRKSWKYIKCM